VHRIKGFVKLGENRWLRINADALKKEFEVTENGREALIVIGEDLNREAIDICLKGSSKYAGELG
jgi:hypothetical protein